MLATKTGGENRSKWVGWHVLIVIGQYLSWLLALMALAVNDFEINAASYYSSIFAVVMSCIGCLLVPMLPKGQKTVFLLAHVGFSGFAAIIGIIGALWATAQL